MNDHHVAETVTYHVKQNLAVYIAIGVVGPFILSMMVLGLLSYLDSRHEPTGAVARSELNSIRREIRRNEDYIEEAPSNMYDNARRAQVRYLRDEEKRIMEELSLSAPGEDF